MSGMIDSNAEEVVGFTDEIVVTDATPEGAVKAQVGAVAIDATAGAAYVKASGDYTDTGWADLTTALKAELLDIVTDAADFAAFKTALDTAWGEA